MRRDTPRELPTPVDGSAAIPMRELVAMPGAIPGAEIHDEETTCARCRLRLCVCDDMEERR